MSHLWIGLTCVGIGRCIFGEIMSLLLSAVGIAITGMAVVLNLSERK